MKVRKQVVVELAPGRVGIGTIAGNGVVQKRLVRIPVRAGEAFATTVAAAGEPLAQMVRELGLVGARATVVFSSPNSVVGVYSCPRKAGAKAARRAAQLALSDAGSMDPASNPWILYPLCVDQASGSEQSQIHTLGCISHDGEIEAIGQFAAAAGLELDCAVAASSVEIIGAVRRALELSKASANIVLHISDQESTIVGVAGGRLRFVRQVSLGVESLVDSISREPIAAVDGTMHTLDRDAARSLLLKAGIPSRGQNVELSAGVQTNAIMPIMQPLLQRLVVEAKQSSRFGLSEVERESATLHVDGPGSAIPRLAPLIAEMAGLKGVEETNLQIGVGELYVKLGKPDLGVLSLQAGETRLVGAARQGVLVGGVAAAIVLGLVWGVGQVRLARMRSTIASLTVPGSGTDETQMLAQTVRALEKRIAEGESRLGAQEFQWVSGDALLKVIGQSAPQGLKLTSVELDASEKTATARIAGRVVSSEGRDPTRLIGQFLDGLSKSPLIRQCRLTSTNREGGNDAIAFDMSLDLVRLPPSRVAEYSSLEGGHE